MEKLNIAELLKDCPKGTKLYTTVWGDVEFIKSCDMGMITVLPIYNPRNTLNRKLLYSDGRFVLDGECILFPSKENRDWSTFQRPFKDGDIVFYNDTIAIFKEWSDETLFRTYVTKYLCCDSLIDKNVPLFGKYIRKNTRLATEEEKQKLFDAIKGNGYKWNAKTKTLEELIVPKFKVWDRIKEKQSGVIGEVIDVQGNKYNVKVDDNKGFYVWFHEQDNYELLPNKFDITTLKPFNEVLVRQNNHGKWGIDFFGFYSEGFYYTTGSAMYVQCVPYKDNEHLRGTTNDCDEYYKTWE